MKRTTHNTKITWNNEIERNKNETARMRKKEASKLTTDIWG